MRMLLVNVLVVGLVTEKLDFVFVNVDSGDLPVKKQSVSMDAPDMEIACP